MLSEKMQASTSVPTETSQISPVEEVEEEDTAESENGEDGERRTSGGTPVTVGRVVTLQQLLDSGMLQPGEGVMTIEYLGQKFVGDLLEDGKIKSQETDRVFATPSAWAVNCKKIINPDKKSGCGWASVRYKGRKLDVLKSFWLNKKRPEEQNKENENLEDDEMDLKTDTQPVAPVVHQPRIIVKHSILGNRIFTHDQNVLVESSTFSSIGKIQPFLITLSTNVSLVIDYHCHLTTSEVVGYLAGVWDINTHSLNITHVYPCHCRLGDYESAPKIENEIRKNIESNGLSVVGWYHSHYKSPCTPTLRDIDTQLDYQLRMKGSSDSTYVPCVGIICSPYNEDSPTLESAMLCYWIIPPPEHRPHEYGKPMTMSYTVMQEYGISHELLSEMKKLADFYQPEVDYINFTDSYNTTVTYTEKLKASISARFPKELQKTDQLWNFIREIISTSREKTEEELLQEIVDISSVASTEKVVAKTISSPSSTPATTLTSLKSTNKFSKSAKDDRNTLASLSNYFVGSDIASALFGASKYPASLMNLDPTTKSLLNLNTLSLGSMFLPPLGSYKSDAALGLMKPPPPPTSYYSSSSSSSATSSSPSSFKTRSSPSRSTKSSSSIPQKIPKLDLPMPNFLIPSNLGKNCTITSRTSTSSK